VLIPTVAYPSNLTIRRGPLYQSPEATTGFRLPRSYLFTLPGGSLFYWIKYPPYTGRGIRGAVRISAPVSITSTPCPSIEPLLSLGRDQAPRGHSMMANEFISNARSQCSKLRKLRSSRHLVKPKSG
jgi:hypothetical protein